MMAAITGPVQGGRRGWPFAATAVDLTAAGYVEEEYFLAGEVPLYRLAPGTDYSVDGRWRAEERGKAPFRTRVLVRVPADRTRFNGTILVTWNNVSAGYENVAELSPEVTEGGFAQLCVSAQRVGVHGFPFPNPQGLVTWDPDRYGELSIDDDDLSYGIFTEAGRAAAELTGVEGKVVAIGGSQSAMRLATYVNAVQPLTHCFDGFVLDVYLGTGTLLDASDSDAPRFDFGPMTGIINLLATAHRVRDDLDIPVLVLNSETEAGDYSAVRQPDTDHFRLWEVAGAAHASSDRWDLADARAARDFDGGSPSPFLPPANRNTVSLDPVRDAVLRHMHTWVHGGPPPPVQPRLDLSGDPAKIVRDDRGNAMGGIRLPDVDVPIAAHTGERTHPIDLFGSSTPFSADLLRQLYHHQDDYVALYDAAAATAVQAGVLLERDAERLKRQARERPLDLG